MKKTLLGFAIAICFAPLTALWGFGVLFYVPVQISIILAWEFSGQGIVSLIGLLVLTGAAGLLGLYKACDTLSDNQPQEFSITTNLMLTAGIGAALAIPVGNLFTYGLWGMISLISIWQALMFMLPVCCALVILYLGNQHRQKADIRHSPS